MLKEYHGDTTDLQEAIALGTGLFVDLPKYKNQYGIRLETQSALVRTQFINGQQIDIPEGFPLGIISFLPKLGKSGEEINDIHGNKKKFTEILIYAVKGMAQFSRDMTRRENRGIVLPTVLLSSTDERMANLARRWGFYTFEDNEVPKVIGATRTVRQHANALGDNEHILNTLYSNLLPRNNRSRVPV